MPHVFRQPDYVPTKWLIALAIACVSFLAGAVSIGIWIEGLDSRISASELAIKENGTHSERIIQRLDSIDHRLSVIEGRLDRK